MSFPKAGSTEWRRWLTEQLKFRQAQAWRIEGLIALSQDEQTPGRLYLLDEKIANVLWNKDLEHWQDIRERLVDNGLLYHLTFADGPGYYEFTYRFCHRLEGDLRNETQPAFTWEQRDASFDSLFASCPDTLPADLSAKGRRRSPQTPTERQWRCRHLKPQFEATYQREMRPEEIEEWLLGVRAWVADGNDGKLFVWRGFVTGGKVSVTKTEEFSDAKNVTDGEKRDVTGVARQSVASVVVASASQNTTENNNNNTANGRDVSHAQNRDNGTENVTERRYVPTEAEIQELLALLKPFAVTEHTVRHELLSDPTIGYAICLRQAKFLPYREATNPGGIYVEACRKNFERPPGYVSAEAQRHRAEDEAKAREMAEQNRREREARESEKASLARQAEDFKRGLSSGYKAYLEDCVLETCKRKYPNAKPIAQLKQPIELAILEDWQREMPTLPEDYHIEIQVPDIPEERTDG